MTADGTYRSARAGETMTAQPKPTAADVRDQVARTLWIGEQETDETRDAAARYWDNADFNDSVIPRPYYRAQADRLAAAGLLTTAEPLSDAGGTNSLIRKRASRDAFGTHDVMLTVQFDRWLAEHDAQVAAQALRDAADEFPTDAVRRYGHGRQWLHARAAYLAGGAK